MGRQRNNFQMNGKEEVSETMLNEKEASQLLGIEFKQWLSGSSQRIAKNYR